MSHPAAGPPPGGLIGRTLAGNYLIERKIGDGGMGGVYAARHTRLPARFAIKVLNHTYADSDEVVRRFQHEAEITSSLRHPNIVRVTDFNQLPDGTIFLVMEYLEGEDLATRVHRRRNLPLPEFLQLLRQLCSALSAAHKHGVVHRDLKPQNVFLAREDYGEGLVETVKILDFGISKMRHVQREDVTRAGRLLGTPQFMSPEQAMGQNERVDARTDQFALGSIAYYALSGQMPFNAPEVSGVLYQVIYKDPVPLHNVAPVSREVSDAVATAMAKRPEDRYQQVTEFLQALLQAAQGTVMAQPAETRLVALPAEKTVTRPPAASDPARTTVFAAVQETNEDLTPAPTRVLPEGAAPVGLSTTLSSSMATTERPATAAVGRPRRGVLLLGSCIVLLLCAGLVWRHGQRGTVVALPTVRVDEVRTGDSLRAAAGDKGAGDRPGRGEATVSPVLRHLAEGEAELLKEDYVAAKRSYEQALLLSPGEVAAKIGLAKIEMRKGNYAGALRWVREAVTLKPDDAGLQLLLCEVRFRLRDRTAARSACERALQLDSSTYGAAQLLRAMR